MNNFKCPYCKSIKAQAENRRENFYRYVECPSCGNYFFSELPTVLWEDISNKIASYLYYNNHGNKCALLGSSDALDKLGLEDTYIVTRDEVESFWPQSISERIDKILLGLAAKSLVFGKVLHMSQSEMNSCLFIEYEKGNDNNLSVSTNQITYLSKYFKENQMVTLYFDRKQNQYCVFLNLEGWRRAEELRKTQSDNSRNVFVAMSFSDEMKSVRKAIVKALTESGYTPRIMDEIEHNHQIVPEMLYEIRKAKFVVVELTGHNNGAYFEAGYALGIGKEVIQLCKKDVFGTDCHFDVKQVNTIMWNNEEDLTKRLIDRIKATIQ